MLTPIAPNPNRQGEHSSRRVPEERPQWASAATTERHAHTGKPHYRHRIRGSATHEGD